MRTMETIKINKRAIIIKIIIIKIRKASVIFLNGIRKESARVRGSNKDGRDVFLAGS